MADKSELGKFRIPAPVGEVRIYNQELEKRGYANVIKWEVIEVTSGDKLRIIFESANSVRRQGVALLVKSGHLVVNGQQSPNMSLWFDSAPGPIFVECFPDDGKVSMFNIWEKNGDPSRRSQADSSGMRVEDVDGGHRYSCSDYSWEPTFDSVVFRMERLS